MDGFLHCMKLFLGIQKTAGDRIFQQRFAVPFKRVNFVAR
jgi:hypothetical protein